MVRHENRGLNPHIEDIARKRGLGIANFMAFASDGLTSVGGYPGDDDKGGQPFRTVDGGKMLEDFLAVAKWLKPRDDGNRQDRRHRLLLRRGVANKLAVRMGCRSSGRRSLLWPNPPMAGDVPKIKAAILVQHGEKRTRGLPEPGRHTIKELKAAGVTHEGYIYAGAVHGVSTTTPPPPATTRSSGQTGVARHDRLV